MNRNRGRSGLPGTAVDDLVSSTVARMSALHPWIGDALVDAVVYHAAVELLGATADEEHLRRMLEQRVHARLMALTGTPIPTSRAPW